MYNTALYAISHFGRGLSSHIIYTIPTLSLDTWFVGLLSMSILMRPTTPIFLFIFRFFVFGYLAITIYLFMSSLS